MKNTTIRGIYRRAFKAIRLQITIDFVKHLRDKKIVVSSIRNKIFDFLTKYKAK